MINISTFDDRRQFKERRQSRRRAEALMVKWVAIVPGFSLSVPRMPRVAPEYFSNTRRTRNGGRVSSYLTLPYLTSSVISKFSGSHATLFCFQTPPPERTNVAAIVVDSSVFRHRLTHNQLQRQPLARAEIFARPENREPRIESNFPRYNNAQQQWTHGWIWHFFFFFLTLE